MLDSGFQNKAVRTLATAGSSSDYAVVERNLHSRFASEYAVEPFYISLTLHDRETWRPQVQLVATVAPYEIFSALYAAPGAPFRTTMMPTGEDAVGRYWDDALRSSWGRNHACNCDPNLSIHRCRVIPVAYHSDGVEVYDGTEFHVFSWSSLLANKGDILDHKLLVCCIEENLLVKDKTFAELIFSFTGTMLFWRAVNIRARITWVRRLNLALVVHVLQGSPLLAIVLINLGGVPSRLYLLT